MNGPIPVTVVTGFLGSGKTTLLTSLVKHRQMRRLALLINEFGEVSIDGALVRKSAAAAAEIQIHDFPYGLIAYGDDTLFVPTLRAIAARRAQFDHVLIETSGLALPSAVMERLQAPELANDFVLDATLTVVDTPLLLANEFDRVDGANAVVADSVATLFEQQLEYADVVVLNKIDTLDEAALLAAEARVRRLAPNVRFIELAYQARLDTRLALGLRLHQPTADTSARYLPLAPMPDANAQPLREQRRLDGHSHSGLNAHAHGLTTHKHFHEQDPGWLSFVLRSTEPQETDRLKAAVVAAAKAEPILRVKGFIRAKAGERVLLQGVRTRVVTTIDNAALASASSELVFIGYHLNRGSVAERLTQLTGKDWK
ncbi:MAG: GTP-binding protein [Gammaproteobacteria bacterium]|nr:GTP-binding protein [Gammaproteobacteria bacterium]